MLVAVPNSINVELRERSKSLLCLSFITFDDIADEVYAYQVVKHLLLRVKAELGFAFACICISFACVNVLVQCMSF